MGEQEVLECLKKNKGWMSPKEIGDEEDTPNFQNCSKHLRKLYKRGLVERKDRDEGRYSNHFNYRFLKDDD